MNLNKIKITELILILITASNAQAELKVLADLGGESAVRFYEPIQPVHSSDAPKHPNAVPAQLSEEQLLPVISHQWSPGKIEPQKFPMPGALPLFLIGADDLSRQWLKENQQRLTEMNATGLVVNVKTMEELNALREIVPQLELLPSPADVLAERLGIHHYPLLLTSEGISQ